MYLHSMYNWSLKGVELGKILEEKAQCGRKENVNGLRLHGKALCRKRFRGNPNIYAFCFNDPQT